MIRYLVLISLLSFPVAVNAENSKDDSPVEKRCKAHVTAKKKSAFQTTCGENQGVASNLRQVHEAGLEACEHSVRVVELLKEKTAEITRDGTNDAKEMQAELKKIDSLSATDAMKKAKEANNTVLEKFQMKNAVIKHQLEQYSKVHNRLQEVEAAYDKAAQPLAHHSGHDTPVCQSEKQYWRGQVNSLDSEVTSVRKEAAANIQALNAIYQKNMTTIGASQKQATQLTKSIAGMESLVKEDGSVDAKKSWWEKITGTDSPHEKEWVKTDCPPGSDQSACYDRAYKARSSSISDEAIGDISSPMQRKMTEPLPSGSSREAAVAAGGATPNEGASPKKYAGVLSDMTDVANGGSGYMSVDDMKKEGYSKAEIDRVLAERESMYGKDGAKKIEEMTQGRDAQKAGLLTDHSGLMSRDEMKRLGYTDEKIQGIMADREKMYGKETAGRMDAEATAREHGKINGHASPGLMSEADMRREGYSDSRIKEVMSERDALASAKPDPKQAAAVSTPRLDDRTPASASTDSPKAAPPTAFNRDVSSEIYNSLEGDEFKRVKDECVSKGGSFSSYGICSKKSGLNPFGSAPNQETRYESHLVRGADGKVTWKDCTVKKSASTRAGDRRLTSWSELCE